MIMKILTTMRSNHIVISILYPLFKLMTLSLLLEMFELFNTVFDKEIFHIELPLLQYFLQKHVRDVHLVLSLVGCGIAFKDAGYGDVKHRVVLLPSSSILRSRQCPGRLSLYGLSGPSVCH